MGKIPDQIDPELRKWRYIVYFHIITVPIPNFVESNVNVPRVGLTSIVPKEHLPSVVLNNRGIKKKLVSFSSILCGSK